MQIRFKNQSAINETEVMLDGHLLTVPGCPSGSCPLSVFKAATQAVIPENWDAECGRDVGPTPAPAPMNMVTKGLAASTIALALCLFVVVRAVFFVVLLKALTAAF